MALAVALARAPTSDWVRRVSPDEDVLSVVEEEEPVFVEEYTDMAFGPPLSLFCVTDIPFAKPAAAMSGETQRVDEAAVTKGIGS